MLMIIKKTTFVDKGQGLFLIISGDNRLIQHGGDNRLKLIWSTFVDM